MLAKFAEREKSKQDVDFSQLRNSFSISNFRPQCRMDHAGIRLFEDFLSCLRTFLEKKQGAEERMAVVHGRTDRGLR